MSTTCCCRQCWRSPAAASPAASSPPLPHSEMVLIDAAPGLVSHVTHVTLDQAVVPLSASQVEADAQLLNKDIRTELSGQTVALTGVLLMS